MTPAARTEAAIELLDAIIDSARQGGAAADTLITRYFSTRRYAGSKDRRAVRELVYAAIRLLGERPATGRAAMVALALGYLITLPIGAAQYRRRAKAEGQGSAALAAADDLSERARPAHDRAVDS